MENHWINISSEEVFWPKLPTGLFNLRNLNVVERVKLFTFYTPSHRIAAMLFKLEKVKLWQRVIANGKYDHFTAFSIHIISFSISYFFSINARKIYFFFVIFVIVANICRFGFYFFPHEHFAIWLSSFQLCEWNIRWQFSFYIFNGISQPGAVSIWSAWKTTKKK